MFCCLLFQLRKAFCFSWHVRWLLSQVCVREEFWSLVNFSMCLCSAGRSSNRHFVPRFSSFGTHQEKFEINPWCLNSARTTCGKGIHFFSRVTWPRILEDGRSLQAVNEPLTHCQFVLTDPGNTRAQKCTTATGIKEHSGCGLLACNYFILMRSARVLRRFHPILTCTMSRALSFMGHVEAQENYAVNNSSK